VPDELGAWTTRAANIALAATDIARGGKVKADGKT
jgi:hypothetical protein